MDRKRYASLNLVGREENGIVEREEMTGLRDEIVERLRSLSNEKGRRIFQWVRPSPTEKLGDVYLRIDPRALVHGEFVLIGDPETKTRIREAAEAEERENYERRFPPAWIEDLAPLGTDWHKPFLTRCPWLLAVFARQYRRTEGGIERHYYVQESVGMAVGFLLAALHHAGLATLTHTPSPMGFLRNILDRPENERPYVLIALGQDWEKLYS